MAYTDDYVKTNWTNKPSTNTPVNQTNLNHAEQGIKNNCGRVANLSTTKAEQSDLLTVFKSVAFDSATGTFTFTKFNDTTVTINTDLEKLAVNFDYDDDPTSPHYQNLVITLADGTVKYADLSALITQYEFTNTSTISFTIAAGGEISANVIDGSITASKLQPNFLADCQAAKTDAENAANSAEADALVSEGYAKGTQNGIPVSSGSPYYENNAEYFKNRASQIVGSKVDSFAGQYDNTPRTGAVTAQAGDYMNIENAIAVNMIPYPYSIGGGSSRGVHWSIKSDGGIEIYTDVGGATQNRYLTLLSASAQKTIPDGDYVVTLKNSVTGVKLILEGYDKTTLTRATGYGASDVSNGLFTKSDGDTYYTQVVLKIDSGTEILEANKITVYPMLESGSVAHDYAQYITDGKHINEVVHNLKLDTLLNVNIVSPQDGEVLKYDANTDTWVNGTGGGFAPQNVVDLSATPGNGKITLKWSDPGDTIIDGVTICKWQGTKVVMKAGSYPSSITDGTLVVDNTVLDQYKTNGYEVTGLTNGTTYYFQLFPYSDTGATNKDVANRISETPIANVTVTLTLNGAKEDSITIYDSNNTQVGSCVFASGQTSGTVQLSLLQSETLTFVSSIGKDITDITQDFSVPQLIDLTPAQTVNVYPTTAIYWYGNKLGNTITTVDGQNTMTFTENTNNITYSAVSWGSGHNPYMVINKSIVGATKIGAIYSGERSGDTFSAIVFDLNGVTTVIGYLYDNSDPSTIATKSKEFAIANLDTDNIRIYVGLNSGSTAVNSLILNALWL